VYEEQFLSVILPKSATNTLILDGLPANAVFNDIPTSDYAYANIPVSVGVHEIEAAKPMALYAYGYGYANSYGYIGGMSFKILDHMPPEIMSQKDCFSFSGVINDTTEYDSGIERVEIHAQENVANLNIGQFGDSIKTVAYSGAVADPYKDTRFILRAFDYQNIRTSDTITIPGFTVSLKGDPELQQIPEYLSEIPFIRDHCFNVTLENYGSFQQEFDINELFDLPDLNVQMNPTGTVVLTPGDELDITICLDPEIEMIVSDTLRLKNKCSSRDIAVFKLNALDDPNPPAASVSGDDCNREFIVVATDSLKSDFGFGDYEIIEQENCVILPEYQDIGLIRLKIEVTDPLLDATYKIAFYDLADKSDTVSAVIPGFTLNILSAGGGPKYIDSRFGAMRCDTVLIENYGNYPLELDKLLMEENIYFSVPLSQFPLTVNPGDSARVAVCFRPMSIGETLNDKLKLIYNCLEKNLEVEGEGKPLAIKSENKCGITIGFSSDDNSSAGAGAVYPNPAGDELNILINNQIRQPLNLQIFDTNGSVVAKEFYGPLPQGENTLKLDLDNISNGVYYYRISSGIFSAGGKFSVIK
ncbi:MAG: T9SS type A sorting domain-containing protein, partial [Candidatus Kapaibacterium sp.]